MFVIMYAQYLYQVVKKFYRFIRTNNTDAIDLDSFEYGQNRFRVNTHGANCFKWTSGAKSKQFHKCREGQQNNGLPINSINNTSSIITIY